MAFLEVLPKHKEILMPVFCKRYVRGTMDIKKREFHGLHYHDYCEIVYCIRGVCTILLADKKYRIKEGELFIVRNNEPHDVGTTESEAEYYVLRFLPDVLVAREQSIYDYSYLMFLLQNDEKHQSYFSSDEILEIPARQLMERMAKECSEKRFGYELSLRADTMTLFLDIMRKWYENSSDISETSISGENSIILEKAIDYIENNFSDVTEKKCADYVFVSTAHLSRIFRKGIKTTFNAFVNEVKLREAQKLLASENISITEVSERVGYSNVAYFIKVFKRKYGITPAKYRRLKMV